MGPLRVASYDTVMRRHGSTADRRTEQVVLVCQGVDLAIRAFILPPSCMISQMCRLAEQGPVLGLSDVMV